jgi:hypothetical protein
VASCLLSPVAADQQHAISRQCRAVAGSGQCRCHQDSAAAIRTVPLSRPCVALGHALLGTLGEPAWNYNKASSAGNTGGACLELQQGQQCSEHWGSLLGITTRPAVQRTLGEPAWKYNKAPARTLGDLGSTCNKAACRNNGEPAWNHNKALAGTLGDLGSTCNQVACRNTRGHCLGL